MRYRAIMTDPKALRNRAAHLLLDTVLAHASGDLAESAMQDLAAYLTPIGKYRNVLIQAALQQAEDEVQRVYVIGGHSCLQ